MKTDLAASVVIPAYNEATVIERCLRSLGAKERLRVVVSANGCHDDTATRARALGVHVEELAVASKIAALNAGDAASGGIYPRIYLDADMELGPGAVSALVQALATEVQPIVAMPRLVFDTKQCARVVRAFYRVYVRLPYISEHLVGSGCYAVNEPGRTRWDSFPQVVADDLFVQGLFSVSERIVVRDVYCVARPPRDVRSLLKVRTRVYQGNDQLGANAQLGTMVDSTRQTVRSLMRLSLRQPWRILDVGVFVAVTAIARQRARSRGLNTTWLTDDSSR